MIRKAMAGASLAVALGGVVSVVALAQPHHPTADLVTPQTAVPESVTSSTRSATTSAPTVTTTSATTRPVVSPTTTPARTVAPVASTGTPAPAQAPVRHVQAAPAAVDTATSTPSETQPAQQRPLPTVPGTTTGPTGQFGPTSGITTPAHP